MQRPTQRGRPRKYATAKDKAAADYERQRNKRQKAAAGDGGLPYSNFHHFHYPVQQLDNSQRSTFAQLQEQDISNFLPPPSPPLQPITEGVFADHNEPLISASTMSSPFLLAMDPQVPGDINEQGILSTGSAPHTEGAVAVPSHQDPDLEQNIVSDTTSEVSPQIGDGELGPIEHLAQEVAEQLIKFQGCCNECHQTARSHHMEDPNYHISLAEYLEFTPELGPDILGIDTIALQKDDLTGKLSPESRRQVFCGIDSRDKVPYEDERVTDNAGITFDIDSVLAFPSNIAVAKQGIHWSPTQMAVSDLQSDLILRC